MPDCARFIVIECADPALLDDLVDRLYRWLRESDIPAEQTGEPTRGPVGAQVRLSQQGRLRIDPAALALLQVADRLDHLASPGGTDAWLDQGRAVLCAGYLLASLASQWEQIDPEWWVRINERCRTPDLTLYVETAARSPEGERLQACYAQAADYLRTLGQAILTVDGTTVGDVLSLCQQHMRQVLF